MPAWICESIQKPYWASDLEVNTSLIILILVDVIADRLVKDAFIVRNAGGNIQRDIGDLIVLDQLLYLQEVLLIKHAGNEEPINERFGTDHCCWRRLRCHSDLRGCAS